MSKKGEVKYRSEMLIADWVYKQKPPKGGVKKKITKYGTIPQPVPTRTKKVTICGETPKAYLIKIISKTKMKAFWVPKSQVAIREETKELVAEFTRCYMTIPQWLLNQNNK
jgi:hypothetical protein